jgi:hypothetical protein
MKRAETVPPCDSLIGKPGGGTRRFVVDLNHAVESWIDRFNPRKERIHEFHSGHLLATNGRSEARRGTARQIFERRNLELAGRSDRW